MEIDFLLLILISFIIGCIMVFAFMGPRESWDPDMDSGALSLLGQRKDKLLRVLKDLDEEREMGSIEEGEYLQLRRSYKARAVVALREFERVRDARLRRLRHGKVHVTPELLTRIEKKVSRKVQKLSVEKGEG